LTARHPLGLCPGKKKEGAPGADTKTRAAKRWLAAVIPGRAEGANPESIATKGAITDRQGLWIPAFAGMTKKAERWLFEQLNRKE
jgi:hypothetical protein